jgi:predicted nucleic-acid-binding protein
MDRIIIDTNLIVRYLVNDHHDHYEIARKFFELVRAGKIKALLEQSVFTETIFVLAKIYEVPKDKIKDSLIGLLEYKGIYNLDKEILVEALDIYVTTNLHIVDCIIIARAEIEKIAIKTFDQELLNHLAKRTNTMK